jgi:predicted RecB family nuclease
MNITSRLFEAFLKCPTKCLLRSRGETGTENGYANSIQAENETYQRVSTDRVMEGTVQDEHATSALCAHDRKFAKWEWAVNTTVWAGNIESNIHIVERVQSQTRDTFAKFTPTRFIVTNKPNRHDKLLVAFDGLVLSETLKTDEDQGKIIHGKTLSTLVVKTSTLANEVRKINTKILALLANEQPPDVVLNRHCIECEFQARCRKEATDKDDLSLLAGITEKERNMIEEGKSGEFPNRALRETVISAEVNRARENALKPVDEPTVVLPITRQTEFFEHFGP